MRFFNLKGMYRIILFLLFSITVSAQDNAPYSLTYHMQDNEKADAINIVNDGLIVFSGGTCNHVNQFCTNIAKFNFDGELLWDLSVERVNVDKSHHLIEDSYGNLYLSGSSKRSDSEYGQVALIKVSSSGELLWINDYGTLNISETSQSTVLDSGGNILIYSTIGIPSRYLEKMMFKIDTSLGVLIDEFILEDTFAFSYFGNMERSKIEDTNIISFLKFDVIPPNRKGDKSGVVAKFNPDTDTTMQIIREDFDIEKGFYVYPLVYARQLSNGDIIFNQVDHSTAPDQIIMIRMDSEGNIIWERPVRTPNGFSGIYNFRITQNDDIIGVGNNNACPLEDGTTEESGWAFRMNADGELLWQRCFHFFNEDNILWALLGLHDLVELPDGRIAYVGFVTDEFLETDVLLLVTGADGCLEPGCTDNGFLTNIASLESVGTTINVFPNPTSDQLRISIDSGRLPAKKTIQAFTADGKLLFSKVLDVGENQLTIDAMDWTTGNYILKIYDERNHLRSTKLFQVVK